MASNPKCPNCGRPMALIAKSERPDDLNTFECTGCKIVYMTSDHVPMTGHRTSPPR